MDSTNYTTSESRRQKGKHLTIADRCEIMALKAQGWSNRTIASEINCSPSTVGYELKRGTLQKTTHLGRPSVYRADRGQAQYEKNRKNCRKPYKVEKIKEFVEWVAQKIKSQCKWSLDACVGFAKRNKLFRVENMVCTKTLYNALHRKLLPLTLFDVPDVLKRKKRKQGHIPNRKVLGRSIEERVEPVGQEFGHWEIDTVIGKRNGKESVILTLLEMKTRYYITIKVPHKDSLSILWGIEKLREQYKEQFSNIFKTITADNGAEFDRFSEVEQYGTKIYFAHPYSSWERPQNERYNRVLRTFIPKGTSIDSYTQEQILEISYMINSMPRKVLDYQTAEELYEAELDKVYSTK